MKRPGFKPRVEDVARLSGESTATVSRVFRGLPHVRPEKRERVLEAARTLGYRGPEGHTPPVVILVEGDKAIQFNTYQALVLAELTRALAEKGLPFELAPAGALATLVSRPFSGALALVYSQASLEAVSKWKGPLVTVNTRLPGHSAVCSDHRASGRLAVEFLSDQGHGRIALWHTGSDSWGNLERQAGFQEAKRERKIPADPRLCQPLPRDFAAALTALQKDKVTAVVVSAEANSVKALGHLLRLGVRIPKDLSLLGFEFPSVSEHLLPALTSVDQDFPTVARRAVEELSALMGGKAPGTTALLPNRMILRESVKVGRTTP